MFIGIAERKLKTLSLGEMRLSLIARAGAMERSFYLLDEVFSGLSAAVAERVATWIHQLSPDAAVVLTGHDAERLRGMVFTKIFHVADGKIAASGDSPRSFWPEPTPLKLPSRDETQLDHLIQCSNADFYHDFVPIFKNLSFQLSGGDRILLTGPNGSGRRHCYASCTEISIQPGARMYRGRPGHGWRQGDQGIQAG